METYLFTSFYRYHAGLKKGLLRSHYPFEYKEKTV